MKFICSRCGREIDEVEYMEYKNSLSSKKEDLFDESEMCPNCFEMML